jgi:lactate dehydrogenase-like 2-hydroxyacid dehydrogenase
MAIPVLVTGALPASCRQSLEEKYEVHDYRAAADRAGLLREVGPQIRAIAGSGVDADLIAALPQLGIIASFGVGYDTVDTAAARARNVRVTNTPDVLDDAVAELAIGLMLALSRRIVAADRYVRAGKWPAGPYPFTTELTGRTLGIAGLGRIGKEVARRAQGLRMRVVYFGRHRQPKEPFTYYSDLTDMARDSDWLLAMTPGGKATEGLVTREVLQALGPEGNFVNMARGSVVDQEALVDMLVSGALGGAALDVFTEEPQVPKELFGLDNVVLSPHHASGTYETRKAMGDLLIANLDAFFAREPLLSAVV